MKTEQFYSVTQINKTIKELFDNIPLFRNITIKGEVSNFHGRNKSGHLYFSLKDDTSSLSVAIFKYDALRLNVEFKNGDLVYATGSLSSYPTNGTYQLICRDIRIEGDGDLLKKKELLKKKLFQEGLFDAAHKKELPLYPEKIAIITGKNSAAAKDFVFNINRRYPVAKIDLFYSLVQGEEAPKELISSLEKAILSKPDLIIIGRGGGSTDDLEAFDDEMLVRAIYDCNIPVISAVGHEINLSLCDLVADKHASTPTGAAELAVPDVEDVFDEINQKSNYLDSLINYSLTSLEKRLYQLKSNKVFTDLSSILNVYNEKIEKYNTILNSSLISSFKSCKNKINHYKQAIELINPSNLLEQGYSMLFSKDGQVLTSVNSLSNDDEVIIKLKDGEILTQVKEKLSYGK